MKQKVSCFRVGIKEPMGILQTFYKNFTLKICSIKHLPPLNPYCTRPVIVMVIAYLKEKER